MKQNKVENTILIIIFLRSLFLLFFNKLNITNLLLGSILGLLLIIIYQTLNLKKYKLFQIILLIILIFISSYTLSNTSLFIKDTILRNTSLIIIMMTLIALSLYITIQGYHSYIKTIELSTYILISMYIISIILLIPHIKINNLYNINYFITPNFIKIALFILLIFICLNYLNDYKINYKIYSISIINIIFIKLFNLSIISQTLENVFKYPYISVFKKISYFDFIERLEGFLSVQYLFDYLFLFTLFFLNIKFIIKDLFKIKKNKTLNFVLFIISFIILLTINIY